MTSARLERMLHDQEHCPARTFRQSNMPPPQCSPCPAPPGPAPTVTLLPACVGGACVLR